MELNLDLTLSIQQALGSLAPLMEAVSLLGTETFFLLIIPAVYWCYDPALGLRTAAALFLSTGINSVFKMAAASPRPYWVDPRVQPFGAEQSFGMPSNHAQTAMAFWGTLAWQKGGQALRTAVIVLVFLIGLSRIVLGVHFLGDVLVGWVLGILVLWLVVRFGSGIEKWALALPLRSQLRLIAAVSLVLVLMVATPSLVLTQPVPQEWQNAQLAAWPGHPLDPYSNELAYTLGGIALGIFGGAAIYRARYGGYQAQGKPAHLILRYLIGLAGILLVWYVLGSLLPDQPESSAAIFRYLRYALLGFWMSFLAPLVFRKIGILER